MKRSVFLLCFIILLSISFASAEKSGIWTYEILEGGTLRIKECSLKKDESITIPTTLDGHTVTEIGWDIFGYSYNNTLKTIQIPDTVTKINNTAFDYCTALQEFKVSLDNPVYAVIGGVLFNKEERSLIKCPTALSASKYTIPEGITKINEYAFKNCLLEQVSLPSTLTQIGYGAFMGSSLVTISIPQSVVRYSRSVFESCISLQHVELPETFVEISTGMFAYCSSLQSINLPNGLTKIGISSFSGCESLKEITLPDSLQYIGCGAFEDCSSLKALYLPAKLTAIGVGYSIISGNKVHINSFAGCNELELSVSPMNTTFRIEEGLLVDHDNMIICCAKPLAGKITIPKQITGIYERSFKNCTGITEIVFNDTIKIIPERAFYHCTQLISVTMPEYLSELGEAAFCECSSLTSIILPNGITKIESSTFSECTALSYVQIPDGVTKIAAYAFEKCTALKEINIPESVQEIGESWSWSNPFRGCPMVTVTVARDSYAQQYCKDNQIDYIYPDTYDWLKNK